MEQNTKRAPLTVATHEWPHLAENPTAERRQVGALLVRDGTIISDDLTAIPAGFENVCEDTGDRPNPTCRTPKPTPSCNSPEQQFE